MDVLIFLWLGCAVLTASVAKDKRRDGCAWLIAGLLLGPLAFLAALVVPKESEK